MLVEVLLAPTLLLFGWGGCSWSCSQRVDCPRYKKKKLEKWQQEEEQKLHERHPTPPEAA